MRKNYANIILTMLGLFSISFADTSFVSWWEDWGRRIIPII
ncbi:hypothetical protein CHISP_0569 [Chitinispirillum alkaliphilum]|nr:hypothetical protein CHISP_0569 [Chitinispirillum alkaliphilum]